MEIRKPGHCYKCYMLNVRLFEIKTVRYAWKNRFIIKEIRTRSNDFVPLGVQKRVRRTMKIN